MTELPVPTQVIHAEVYQSPNTRECPFRRIIQVTQQAELGTEANVLLVLLGPDYPVCITVSIWSHLASLHCGSTSGVFAGNAACCEGPDEGVAVSGYESVGGGIDSGAVEPWDGVA